MTTSADQFDGARVLVGVTGGIAAFKAAALVSALVQRGCRVSVAMTPGATRFVTPLTFEALSGQPVQTDAFVAVDASDPQHIATARLLDAAIVAPCTMDCLARLAIGRADDAVTLILSAIDRARTPVLLAPAMNERMWAQPSTQRNTQQLVADGFTIVGPATGWQACRAVGPGRMAEPEAIIEALATSLAVSGR